jgi:desulfoferrodoxin-like iron-binding protein
MKRRNKMADKKAGDKFVCSVCGNVVVLTKVGGGVLVCCGKPMNKIG